MVNVAELPGQTGIGLIYPPPEVRGVVDKTASFVARNGYEFQNKIAQTEANNAKFDFLKPSSPYHAYYNHMVREYTSGNATEKPAENAEEKAAADEEKARQDQIRQQEQAEAAELALLVPPAEFEFSADPPLVNALDLDVIKLTAQFVARNGRSFLTELMQREARNFQFDFLRPQHSYFTYFTRLVEQYSKVFMPSRRLQSALESDAESARAVYESRVLPRVRWYKHLLREKAEQDERDESERALFQRIDWHDFAVVETVDFAVGEPGDFEPPVNKEDIGARLVAWERFEQQQKDLAAAAAAAAEADSDADMDMDESDDDDDGQKTLPAPAPIPMPQGVTIDESVKVVKNYNPKAAAAAAQGQTVRIGTQQQCPRCGLKVPMSDMDQHLKVCMLNPRWKELKDKHEQEKRELEAVHRIGTNVSSSLKQLAERRTDIFGSSETGLIGVKADEAAKQKAAQTASAAAVAPSATGSDAAAAAAAAATKTASAVPTPPAPSAPTSAVAPPRGTVPWNQISSLGSRAAAAVVQAQAATTIDETKSSRFGADAAIAAASAAATLLPTPTTVPQQRSALPGFAAPAPHMGGFIAPPPPPAKRPLDTTEDDSHANDHEILVKRPRTAAEAAAQTLQLVSEEEFLKENSGPVQFTIEMVYNDDESKRVEWGLDGTRHAIEADVTDTVATLKTKIFERTQLPTSKAKLSIMGLFLKDAHSLAHYNVTSRTLLQVALKERGGRKK